ncbi:hypothetical protein KQX54_004916 [Cotesia glomerata]|uniref:Uncharacterized protein n=1 Tax=Cotesia glomerata TaxID=32391 RepID=A0AAV7J2S8_COTGL|nr:hypothetical protein KQX54_004916 [Cotesia glomerata]
MHTYANKLREALYKFTESKTNFRDSYDRSFWSENYLTSLKGLGGTGGDPTSCWRIRSAKCILAAFSDMKTVFLACICTLLPLMIALAIAFGLRHAWRKYRLRRNGTSDLPWYRGVCSRDDTAESLHHRPHRNSISIQPATRILSAQDYLALQIAAFEQVCQQKLLQVDFLNPLLRCLQSNGLKDIFFSPLYSRIFILSFWILIFSLIHSMRRLKQKEKKGWLLLENATCGGKLAGGIYPTPVHIAREPTMQDSVAWTDRKPQACGRGPTLVCILFTLSLPLSCILARKYYTYIKVFEFAATSTATVSP